MSQRRRPPDISMPHSSSEIPKTSRASSLEARRRMQATKQTGTSCELSLQAALRARGLRFRVNWPIVKTRRRADIVFIRRRVAVFVDGCFWHVCPRHATWPKNNASWWRAKLKANVSRDRLTDKHLKAYGWTVLRFWEHVPSEVAARKIESVVSARTGQMLAKRRAR